MTYIFNTSWEHSRMHVWCQFCNCSPNPVQNFCADKTNFLELWVKWSKSGWRSRSMTSISNSSREYPRMHEIITLSWNHATHVSQSVELRPSLYNVKWHSIDNWKFLFHIYAINILTTAVVFMRKLSCTCGQITMIHQQTTICHETDHSPHRRWRWAAFLQRCNNVAQWLSNVLQRSYNVAISCATQHNVVQRDQAIVYLPERCTTLSKRCQTLASVAKPLSNVFQRCLNTWQLAASRWRQAACLQRCNNVAQHVPDAVQRSYNVVISWATQHNVAQHCLIRRTTSPTLPHVAQTLPDAAQCCQNGFQRCSMLIEHAPHLWTCAHLELCADVKQLAYNVVTTWRKSCPTLSSDGTTLL